MLNINFSEIEANILDNKYHYLGTGSGRKVYDLRNGYVVKAARNKKGFAQNKAEHKISLTDRSNIFAKVLGVSDDHQYLIMQKAEKLRNLKPILNYFQIPHINHLLKNDIYRESISNNKLKIPDLSIKSSWGLIDGAPAIIDYGLTDEVYNEYYLKERVLISLLFLVFFHIKKE